MKNGIIVNNKVVYFLISCLLMHLGTRSGYIFSWVTMINFVIALFVALPTLSKWTLK